MGTTEPCHRFRLVDVWMKSFDLDGPACIQTFRVPVIVTAATSLGET